MYTTNFTIERVPEGSTLVIPHYTPTITMDGRTVTRIADNNCMPLDIGLFRGCVIRTGHGMSDYQMRGIIYQLERGEYRVYLQESLPKMSVEQLESLMSVLADTPIRNMKDVLTILGM